MMSATHPHTSRRLRQSALLLSLGAVVATAFLAQPAAAAKGDTDLVSRSDGAAGAAAGDFSDLASISGDGRYVAFYSRSGNLAPGAPGAGSGIYVRDLVDGSTTLAGRSRAFDIPSISDGGRHVAFVSDADDLSDADNDKVENIYVRDLDAGTTVLVTRADGREGAAADNRSSQPSISADGRYVAFSSRADNLSAADNNSVINVFVRDLVSGSTTLVSRAPGPRGKAANGVSKSPSISADGRYVAFSSNARNLSNEDRGGYNIYVRDLVTHTVTLASRPTGTQKAAEGSSFSPSISADGRHVAFRSLADDLSPDTPSSFSGIFVRDLLRNTTTLVSRADGKKGAAAEDVGFLDISGDGRYVVFDTSADNLAPGAADHGFDHVYLRDLLAHKTTLISRATGPSGEGAAGTSLTPSISADGRYAAFGSSSSNLSPLITGKTVSHVFRRDLRGPLPRCAGAPALAGPSGTGTISLTTDQLKINQRIGSAAIRRANAIQEWLDQGIVGSDLCGGSLAPEDLGPGVVVASAAVGPQPAIARPRKLVIAPRPPGEATFDVSLEQLEINQKIYSAAVRRSNALNERLRGLTGGDISDGTLSADRLRQGLTITSRASATRTPAASTTEVASVSNSGASFTLSIEQLQINQRIAAAAIRRTNELRRTIAAGLTGENFVDGSITAEDFAP